MSRNKKICIIIGVVFVIAHFASLALAFHSSRKHSDRADLSTTWTNKMGKWMSFLAPSIDVNSLLCEETRKNPGSIVTLNDDQPSCTVNLSPGIKGDEKFWKIEARRKWAAKQAKVYMLSTIPLRDDNGDRIPLPKNCLKKKSLDEDGHPKGAFWLKIEFVESGFSSRSSDRICWMAPDDTLKIPFIVTSRDDHSNGGTLALSCIGCDKSSNREVMFWFE